MPDLETLYTPCAMLGDGSAGSPRRAGLWMRLDLLIAMIDADLICAKPDGTIDAGKADTLGFGESFVADFGVVGVRTLSLTRQFWQAAKAFEESVTGGTTVAGRNKAELIDSATAKIQWVLARLEANVPANRQLDRSFPTIYDSVRDALTKPVPVDVRPIRNYYANQLDPTTVKLTDVPPFLKKAGDERDTVDPAVFRQARDLIVASTDSTPGRYLHNLYELGYLDVLRRGATGG